ncbi:uncharacterized protein LOC141911948 [Tubulanus polymorphus]|uniref:uncharacterized protein LOC141911948 n=1 Tax=Tubulanus polymorphus TaxID=672921 RepID=UPI003DA3505D
MRNRRSPSSILLRITHSCCSLDTCIAIMSIITVTGSLVVLCSALAWSYPLHASCKIDWTFGEDCKIIRDKILNQISVWKTDDNCKNGGEKCLYTLLSATANTIEAQHTTPVKHYNDTLNFTFNSGTLCRVKARSSSDTWYAILDYGTNYCNLHNLITGAGLDKDTKYSEKTSDSICTQFSSADCDKY